MPLCTLPGMADRTVTISSLSKSFSVTGWRVGWAIAPPHLAGAIRKVHDFLTVGAPAPLQEAAAFALQHARRLLRVARRPTTTCAASAACRCSSAAASRRTSPAGAYYVMTDIREPLARARRRGKGPDGRR